MRAVTVRILASDAGTREGANALLSAHPDIAVPTTRSKTAPDVLFVNSARAIMAGAMIPAPRAGQAAASEAGR